MRSRIPGALRLCVSICTAAMVVWSGCKKEEPAPAATTPPAAEQAKVEGAATAGSEAAKSAAEPGATAKPDGTVPATPPSTDQAARPAPGAVVEAPADVIVYGGTSSLKALIDTANGLATQVAPIPSVERQVQEGLKEALRLSSIDWLDMEKPVKLAVFNPKTMQEGAAVLLPTKGRDEFLKALPEGHKKDADGNEIAYEAGMQKFFVNFVGSDAVLSSSAEVWPKGRDFITGGLKSYTPAGPLEVTVELAHVAAIFGEEMKAGREEMIRSFGMMPGTEGMGETLKKEIEFLFELVDAVDSVDFSIKQDGVHAILNVTARPVAGNKMMPLFTAYQGRRVPLVEFVPSNAYFVFAGSSDPRAGTDLLASMGEDFLRSALKDTLGFSEDEIAKFMDLQKKAVEQGTGESMFAIHPEGAAALAMTGMALVKSGSETRQVMISLLGLLWPKLVDMIKKEAGGELPPGLDLTSFSTAVNGVSAILKEQGVNMSVREIVEGDNVFDMLEIGVDWAKVPDAESQEVATVKSLVGERLQIVLGYGKDRYAFALGSDGLARAKRILEATKGEPPVGLKSGIQKGAPNAAGIVFISAVDGLKAFAKLDEMSEVRSKIETLNADNGVAITLATGDKNALVMSLDIPLDHVKKIIEVFGGR